MLDVLSRLHRCAAEDIITGTEHHNEDAIRTGWQIMNDVQIIMDAWDGRPQYLLWEDAYNAVSSQSLHSLVHTTAQLLHAQWCSERYEELLKEARRRGLC